MAMTVTTVTHLLYFMYTISLMAKLEVLNFAVSNQN